MNEVEAFRDGRDQGRLDRQHEIDRLNDKATEDIAEIARLIAEVSKYRRTMGLVVDQICKFHKVCAAAEYTDTNAVWELLDFWQAELQQALRTTENDNG